MKNAVEGICALCVLCGIVEQVHMGNRYFQVMRLVMALRLMILITGFLLEFQ